MTDTGQQEVIVVGVDGSEPSKQALRWAARQANLTGAPLHAVTAWEHPARHGIGATIPPEDFAATAGEVLSAAVRDALDPTFDGEIRESVVVGHPAQVLIDTAQNAQLLVVGSRGHGGVSGALLGSVSQYCTQHARCPVVVVRAVGHGQPSTSRSSSETSAP